MKLKNISVGDSVQLKKRLVSNIFRKKQVCEVIKINSEHEFRPDVLVKGEYCLGWVNHKDLKKPIQLEPEPKLKVLDQSVFDGLDAKWRFAAVCNSGKAIVAQDKPETLENGYFIEDGYLTIDMGYDTTDWQNSLIERKELTGSDLAKEVLKARCAVARVSDISDFDAADLGSDTASTALLRQCDSGLFNTTNGARRWFYAVLINNQGEPLTQSEVGL